MTVREEITTKKSLSLQVKECDYLNVFSDFDIVHVKHPYKYF